jgi:hypothetical protein
LGGSVVGTVVDDEDFFTDLRIAKAQDGAANVRGFVVSRYDK